jgi:diguanylate cyclase (GGDEF)-like protein/PAS domain S-box-containing protein
VRLLTGEFHSAELEAAYRSDTWPEWVSRLRLVAATGALFYLLGVFLDAFAGHPAFELQYILIIRVCVAAAIVGAAFIAERFGSPSRVLDLVIGSVMIIVALATCWFVSLGRANLMNHALTVVVILVVYYLFVPARPLHVLVSAGVLTSTFLYVAITVYEPTQTDLAFTGLYLGFINLLGASGGVLLRRSRRAQHALLLTERERLQQLRTEVGARQKVEDALAESEERYRSLVELSPNAIVVHRKGVILYINPTGATLMGVEDPAQVQGLTIRDLLLPQYHSQFAQRLRLLEESPKTLPVAEFEVRCLDDRIAHCEVISGPTVFEGEPAIQSVIRDIGDRKQLEDELRRLATTDPLTGICNRRTFFEKYEVEWSRARRHGRPLSVLMLDIDHFKAVNDRFGHAVGDAVLTTFVAVCQRSLRDEDLLARIGGEEFAILLPETAHAAAEVAAERLRHQVAQTRFHCAGQDSDSCLTVSIGVAECDLENGSPDRCLQRADDALYAAKHAGRDTVRLADQRS